MMVEDAQPLVRSRLGALDPLGWAFLAAGSVLAVVASVEAVGVVEGRSPVASVVLFGTWAGFCLYATRVVSQPEVDTRCRECQSRLYVDSARGDRSAAVGVEVAGQPDRLALGPLSIVRSRNRRRYWYCSPVCARADLGPLTDLDDDGVLEPPVPAADHHAEVAA
jgi:hypothetical protein